MTKDGTVAVEESSMVGFQGQLLGEERGGADDVYIWIKKGSDKLRVCKTQPRGRRFIGIIILLIGCYKLVMLAAAAALFHLFATEDEWLCVGQESKPYVLSMIKASVEALDKWFSAIDFKPGSKVTAPWIPVGLVVSQSGCQSVWLSVYLAVSQSGC